MHLLVIGGTGRNGRLVIQQALTRGHTITALVRDAAAAAELLQDESSPSGSITFVEGSPISEEDILKALKSPSCPSAVITTLAIRRTTDSPLSPLRQDSPPDLISSSAAALLAALSDTSLPQETRRDMKIIVNSTQGVGRSFNSFIYPMKMIFTYTPMRVGLEDHEKTDALLRSSGHQFVLARASRLVSGQGEFKNGIKDGAIESEVKVWPEDGKGVAWNPSISRDALAAWLVKAAETDTWDNTSPVLSC